MSDKGITTFPVPIGRLGIVLVNSALGGPLLRLTVRLRGRDVTLPGASHFNLTGCVSLYPGQTVPEVEHRLHSGRVKSQTKESRRHSQQWRFWSSYPPALFELREALANG